MSRVLLLSLMISAIFNIELFAQVNSDLYRNTPRGGVVTSGQLPDITAYSDRGEQLQLRELCRGGYSVIVTGCLTCPEFRREHPTIEAINADYAPRGVKFYFAYKSLRHPELDGYVEAQNISERLAMVERAKSTYGGVIEWIVDDMSNNLSQSLRSGSRSIYIISPEGEILNGWSSTNEQAIREALTRLVGAPKRVTSAEQLNLPPFERAQRRTNVDSDTTIERGDGLVIVKTTPHAPEDIYYVKMRAEADASLLESGTGRLALGFLPDPIHDAHWNNLATPMRYTMSLPKGVKANPATASAKRGRGDSDSEPRQFWVDIKGASPGDEIEITYHYYGCTPDLCEAFTHTYTITLAPEGQGASTFGFNKGGGRGNANRSSQRGEHSEGAARQNRGYNTNNTSSSMRYDRGSSSQYRR